MLGLYIFDLASTSTTTTLRPCLIFTSSIHCILVCLLTAVECYRLFPASWMMTPWWPDNRPNGAGWHALWHGTTRPVTIFITRDSEVIMFSPCACLFVCGGLCVYVCHDVCPDDLPMKDWYYINNILQVHSWWSLVVQVMFHALVTSSMMSACHNRSYFEIALSPSIFQLERRSKAQNTGNAHGYLSGILNFMYYFR